MRPLNFGVAQRGALDRSTWRQLLQAAASTWHAPGRERLRM